MHSWVQLIPTPVAPCGADGRSSSEVEVRHMEPQHVHTHYTGTVGGVLYSLVVILGSVILENFSINVCGRVEAST